MDREIKNIIIHCSATPEGQDMKVWQIEKLHKERGFRKIGYHYVVYRDGSILKGRPDEEPGAHCKGHNADSIGVCYIGGLDKTGKRAKDTRTESQKEALLKLLRVLKERYPKAVISGHRDFSPDLNGDGEITPNEFMKECPCFDARKEYRNLL